MAACHLALPHSPKKFGTSHSIATYPSKIELWLALTCSYELIFEFHSHCWNQDHENFDLMVILSKLCHFNYLSLSPMPLTLFTDPRGSIIPTKSFWTAKILFSQLESEEISPSPFPSPFTKLYSDEFLWSPHEYNPTKALTQLACSLCPHQTTYSTTYMQRWYILCNHIETIHDSDNPSLSKSLWHTLFGQGLHNKKKYLSYS